MTTAYCKPIFLSNHHKFITPSCSTQSVGGANKPGSFRDCAHAVNTRANKSPQVKSDTPTPPIQNPWHQCRLYAVEGVDVRRPLCQEDDPTSNGRDVSRSWWHTVVPDWCCIHTLLVKVGYRSGTRHYVRTCLSQSYCFIACNFPQMAASRLAQGGVDLSCVFIHICASVAAP